MTDKRPVQIGDVFESQDSRDTDPKQPGGLRRVRVRDVFTQSSEHPPMVQVENCTTGRRTLIAVNALQSSKWKLIDFMRD